MGTEINSSILSWGVNLKAYQSLHGSYVHGFFTVLSVLGTYCMLKSLLLVLLNSRAAEHQLHTPVKSIFRLWEQFFPELGRYRSAPDSVLHLRVDSLII